ncbi:HAD-IA family hydrolase [Amycolatopsis sp. OK19-0408]|uniref:HAD-IA family hydrolase n=1 Tax=Amycolatopsis iheyensis TaxID=2945988 RepID=A0A9X2NED5_9PSEU|nr:HAD-IA family hydrolase [Amycolatopsis iheyensis]MCR6485330.1 HAD-IA family hydrolase [Amycolatopsis iheyensis]
MAPLPTTLNRDAIDVVAFDAMGVLYSSADEVEELLVPYLRTHGCVLTRPEIAQLHRECSLGKMSSADFWATSGASGASDEEYTRHHRLIPGVVALLAELDATGVRLACLGNDVSERSKLRRERFGLGEYLTEWVVSGDIRVREPDPEVFAILCRRLDVVPDRVLLIDDSAENVTAAREAGLQALRFGVANLSTMDHLRTELRPW